MGTDKWSTPLTPLQLGVYQGDPLSVVIFNIVINTLVDTLQTRHDLGHSYSQSQPPINLLQYADDTCLAGNSPAACQHLLQMMAVWLEWLGMKAKIPKGACLGLQASSGKIIDQHLSLNDHLVLYARNGVKFRMLTKLDVCPLSRKQRLLKWSGLARSANTTLLFLSGKRGGLNLPLPSTMHKKLQVSRQALLLTSPDSCVRLMAENASRRALSTSRSKFKPSQEVRDVMIHNPDFTRKSLT